MTHDPEKAREALVAELQPLVDKAAGPNGWDWMFPLREVPVDGKPTIVSHKGGNLFRGYIATWDQSRLLIALANAAPRILAALAPSRQPARAEADYLTARVAEIVAEDGGCWRACSGCQESVDGYVSARDYPYSTIFKCQPGSGCHECGGLGVLWQDGAFLASYGDALALQPQGEASSPGKSE